MSIAWWHRFSAPTGRTSRLAARHPRSGRVPSAAARPCHRGRVAAVPGARPAPGRPGAPGGYWPPGGSARPVAEGRGSGYGQAGCSGFAVYIARVLVGAEPVPAGVPHAPVGGPLGERDLAGKPGFRPVRAAGIPGRHRRAERAGIALERCQLPQQVGEHCLGEPGADVPRVPQPAVVVDTQQ